MAQISILTARRRDRLAGLATELSDKHGIRTLVCVADLAQPDGPQQIFSFTEEKNIAIDLLVNNAGFGAYGEFHKVALDRLVEMTQVNVSAVVHLTHLFLPGMIARRSGDILILASAAAFQAGALHHYLRCDESLRSIFCRRARGRSTPVWRACVCAVPRVYRD